MTNEKISNEFQTKPENDETTNDPNESQKANRSLHKPPELRAGGGSPVTAMIWVHSSRLSPFLSIPRSRSPRGAARLTGSGGSILRGHYPRPVIYVFVLRLVNLAPPGLDPSVLPVRGANELGRASQPIWIGMRYYNINSLFTGAHTSLCPTGRLRVLVNVRCSGRPSLNIPWLAKMLTRGSRNVCTRVLSTFVHSCNALSYTNARVRVCVRVCVYPFVCRE